MRGRDTPRRNRQRVFPAALLLGVCLLLILCGGVTSATADNGHTGMATFADERAIDADVTGIDELRATTALSTRETNAVRTGNRHNVSTAAVDAMWEFDGPDGLVTASPTVVDGTVYVGSHDGSVYALDAETGSLEWQFTDPNEGVTQAVTVVDGTVFATAGSPLTADGALYAIDADTGEQIGEPFSDADHAPSTAPTVVDGTVFVGGETAIHAVDPATMEAEWTVDAPERVVSVPVVSDGRVYIGDNDGSVYSLDAGTGHIEWEANHPDSRINGAPAVFGGTVFVGSHDGSLYAYDASDGGLEWTADTPADSVTSTPTVADDTLYVGTADGTLLAVDPTTGTQKWAFTEPEDDLYSSPTVADGRVYVGSMDGTVYGVDTDSGAGSWAFDAPFVFTDSSPVVSDGVLYVGGDYGVDGAVFGIRDGVSGSSTDTRVENGVLGHLDGWQSGTLPNPGGPTDAILSIIDHETGAVEAGDSVEVDVEVTANAATTRDYYLGFSVRHEDGDVFDEDESTGRVVTLAPGESTEYTVEWEVESDAPNGAYDAIVKLWDETDQDDLTTELAGDTQRSAFALDDTDHLAIETTRTETEPLSPITLRIPLVITDTDSFSWTVESTPSNAEYELLHRDREHTAFHADTPGTYELRVQREDEAGTLLAEGTTEVTVTAEETVDINGRSLGMTEAELVETYAPTFHFHHDEQYYPTRYEAFIEHATIRDGDGEALVSEPSLLNFRYLDDDPLYDISDPDTEIHWNGDKEAFSDVQPTYPRTVYANVDQTEFRGESYVSVTYWKFYLHDPKEGGSLPGWAKQTLSSHPSDTETVTLLINESGPQWVGVAQHYSGEYVRWEAVTGTENSESVDVYPSVGAHSSFLVNTQEYPGKIPGQVRWFGDHEAVPDWTKDIYDVQNSTRTRIPNPSPPPAWFNLGLLSDQTGQHNTWTVEDPPRENGFEYDVIRFPADETWTEFAGTFDGEPGRLSGGVLPTQRGDRWDDVGAWMESRMLPEHEVLDLRSSRVFNDVSVGGEEQTVSGTVTNDGTKPHTFIVEVTVRDVEAGGSVVYETEEQIPLGVGESAELAVPLSPVPDSAGKHDVTVEVLNHPSGVATDEDVQLSTTERVDLSPSTTASVSTEGDNGAQSATAGGASTADETVDVGVGDEVRRPVLVENTGDESHTFFVGLSAEGPDGALYDNDGTTGETITLDPGESETVELTWTVDERATAGSYDLLTSVWYEADRDELFTRLDSSVHADAVEVSRETGELVVTAQSTDVMVDIDDESVGTTPVSTELSEGDHTVRVHTDAYGAAERIVTIQPGVSTTVSADVDEESGSITLHVNGAESGSADESSGGDSADGSNDGDTTDDSDTADDGQTVDSSSEDDGSSGVADTTRSVEEEIPGFTAPMMTLAALMVSIIMARRRS